MEWGREEEKDRMRGTESILVELRTGIKLKATKKRGRIISFPADIGGKIGAKVSCQKLKIVVETQPDEPKRSSQLFSKPSIFHYLHLISLPRHYNAPKLISFSSHMKPKPTANASQVA